VFMKKEDLTNRGLVGLFLLEFLEKDSFCSELKSDWMTNWAKNGLLDTFCHTFFNAEPKTKNLVPWFMDRVAEDLLANQNSNEEQFRNFVDKLSEYDMVALEKEYVILAKHKIDADEIKNDFKNAVSGISDEKDLGEYIFSVFSDGILHAEIRILSHIYKDWFGKEYAYKPE